MASADEADTMLAESRDNVYMDVPLVDVCYTGNVSLRTSISRNHIAETYLAKT